MCKRQRPSKYQRLTEDERREIWHLKQQNVPVKEISKRLGKNYKTVQSVHDPERKKEYLKYERAVENQAFEYLLLQLDLEEFQSFTCKQQEKIVRELVKEEVQNKEKYQHLVPPNRQQSKRRRKIDDMVDHVVRRLNQNSNRVIQQQQPPVLVEREEQSKDLNNLSMVTAENNEDDQNDRSQEFVLESIEDPHNMPSRDNEDSFQLCLNFDFEVEQDQEGTSYVEANHDEGWGLQFGYYNYHQQFE